MVGLKIVDSAVVVAFMCVMFISQASSARVLLDNFLQKDVPIEGQVLYISRPRQRFEVPSRSLEMPMEKKKTVESESKIIAEKMVSNSKYEYLILNVLPKGTRVPPSGPSKRINNYLD